MVPQSRHYSPDQNSTPTVLIEVDEQQLLITQSLADALVRIHHADITSAGGSVRSWYLWADAVCINQGDEEEKSAQVCQMGEIYKRAENVLIWLGEEDEFTDDAMSAIRLVSAIPSDRHNEVTLADWAEQNPVFKKFGLKSPPTWKNWGGLIMFFRRPWFTRVWIIQEVILGRNCIVLCGKQILPWDSVARTLRFLSTTNWSHNLSAVWWRRNLPIPWHLRGRYRALLISDDNLNISTASIILTVTKTMYPAPLAWFVAGLQRESQATDPKDKIFSILGLVDHEQPPFQSHPGQMVADYSLSVEAVYTRTTRMLLEGYAGMVSFDWVEAKPFRRIKTLPSWVPDYSVPLRPPPWCRTTRLLQPETFSANNGISWEITPTPIDNPELEVQGFQLDIISEALERNEADLARYEKSSRELDSHWPDIFTLASKISREQTSCTKSKTRFEVLWRTILLDFYDKQHPAPEVCGLLFMEQFAWSIASWQRSANKSESSQSWYDTALTLLHVDGEQTAGEGQVNLDVDSQPFLRQFQAFYAEAMAAKASPENHTMKFSQLQSESAVSIGTRSRILTQNGRLCVGALSAEPGDEIWILAGVRFPVVLRRVTDGKHDRYSFLGLAFVYGVMQGEAIQSDDDFGTIFLV